MAFWMLACGMLNREMHLHVCQCIMKLVNPCEIGCKEEENLLSSLKPFLLYTKQPCNKMGIKSLLSFQINHLNTTLFLS